MKQRKNIYTELAMRVRQGDRAAELELHDRLGHDMVFVVRRIVRPGGAISSVDREVYAEACRMGLADTEAAPTKREDLIGRLAARLRDRTLRRLVPSGNDDTYANATIRVGSDSSLQMAS